MNLEKATIISLEEFEDTELLKVKPTRSIAEYCWTSTSSTILYVLENFKVDSCTYIDADIFFYASPESIFNEMKGKSILITEHRYSPEYLFEQHISGNYCVQFVTIKNDNNGLKALHWWRDRCLEWCYSYYEDGKFGDQLYLDDWTERFEGVHVLQHLGGGLAPWNIQQYYFVESEGKINGFEKNNTKFEVIFFHFHFLRFYTNGEIELGDRKISKEIQSIFYKPYLKLLEEIKNEINSIDSTVDPHGTSVKKHKIKSPLTYLKRKIKGSHNVFDYKKYMSS